MIVVIDYTAGNLYNVGHALKHLGADFMFSGDPADVGRADKIILPGVGAAKPAMESLADQGLVEALRQVSVPFLGICLGLQLLFEVSEEEDTPCLGLLPGRVLRFDSSQVKVPHIGWNRVAGTNGSSQPASPLFDGVPAGSFFYFVHSYYAPVEEPVTLGTTEYGLSFSSVVVRDNLLGVQFHPERSGEIGLKLLENFVELGWP
ncbi:MAG: imidazole glycerol phosphate synthase subunit HisH [Acidobacteriota bacterium]|nr:imidazole glycerol phosphate synthase subunit HisH [Acidobacteriota bacterium]